MKYSNMKGCISNVKLFEKYYLITSWQVKLVDGWVLLKDESQEVFENL